MKIEKPPLLAIKYSIFAGIATISNIGVQRLILWKITGELSLYIAMLAGTIAGLVIKYILDKKYIFYYSVSNWKKNIGKFLLYSLMGVFTTIIFWASELSFNFFFNFENAKFIGAAVGLIVGYLSKYFLDKKFVFSVTNESIGSHKLLNDEIGV